MSPNDQSVMDTIHVWIGNTAQSREEFGQYFTINAADRDAGIGASQFDKDMGTEWYDDDLIGVYYSDGDADLDAAIEEIPTASDEVEQLIRAKCTELGVSEANAMFYYTDSDLVVPDHSKKYNDLTYLGAFENK